MSPTLRPGDRVIVKTWFIKPKLGDIVVLKNGDPDLIIKRVKKVENGKFWVEGEDSRPSTDSRTFGWKSKQNIAGVALKTIHKY